MMGNDAGNAAPAPQLGLGMFLMPVYDAQKPLAQCYDEDLELAQRCEQFGDPPTVTQQINDLRARIGDFGTLVLVAHDWDDKQRWARSLELFGSEVMPALTA